MAQFLLGLLAFLAFLDLRRLVLSLDLSLDLRACGIPPRRLGSPPSRLPPSPAPSPWTDDGGVWNL